MKQGKFESFDIALASEPISSLTGCFNIPHGRQDAYIANLKLVYKYFKSCRNCCAHGDKKFSNIVEVNYNAISMMKNTDLGVKEFPKIHTTIKGNPLIIYLRGVVGFYDVLIRIIHHYDILVAEKIAVEQELLSRWKEGLSTPIVLKRNVKKRGRSIRNYLKSIDIPPTFASGTHTEKVYNFLLDNKMVKLLL